MAAQFTDLDRKLCQALCGLPRRFDNRYTEVAKNELLETLFRALTNDRQDYLEYLFPTGFPKSYRLQDAQGIEENAEYTEAARGHPCGHIFKQGEASYHCTTCTDDPTCVLCARCFISSDHEGHQFIISASAGNSGCCDCGDEEAWKSPVNCAIHTITDDFIKTEEHISNLPEELQKSMRTTVSRVLDYFCDIISCSPENLRLPKTEESVRKDELHSRLEASHYITPDEIETNPEYSLVIWNDEKHTVTEVQSQVARACRQRDQFGLDRANEANDIGRSVVKHSRDLKELLKMANTIEQIKITVTIRSSRDTFREQMCSTIVEWLSDIAGCSIGGDSHISRRLICEEMLQVWCIGSQAPNARVGKGTLDDHETEDNIAFRRQVRAMFVDPIHIIIQRAAQTAALDEDADEDEDEDEDDMEGEEAFDEDEDEEMAEGVLQTTLIDINATNEALLETRTADADATDDADEIDTDGDVDFVDAGERIEEDEQQTTTDPDANPVPNRNFQNIPKTPTANTHNRSALEEAPSHWTFLPTATAVPKKELPVYENLAENIRIDSMILFDLRLWKQTRIDLRDLFISTVVNIPQFKRILGLRFAGLYTTLAQLYLVADREPDHSIINLSLQMLTSQSITEEVVAKGNFLTNLMAILYTFLTTRQVGFPSKINPNATLGFDAGSVANRRLYHFFSDLRFFLASHFVQGRIREEKQYLFQYLDLAKLSQGICPNVRAVGEHVEYETDAWISASLLTREINKLCRQFAESFQLPSGRISSPEDPVCEAISQTAQVTIMNSVGMERRRFEQGEIKDLVQFHTVGPFATSSGSAEVRVVKFAVATGALSFHHPLHYTVSWLLEIGKETQHALNSLKMAAEHCVARLHESLLGPQDAGINSTLLNGEDALLAMFDYPLRVCGWLSQMKANMWVRNGMSLKHQMTQYKSVTYRDVGHHRDLFLLQTALVACDPVRVLASMVDRFGLTNWLLSDFQKLPDCEDTQMLDLAEDFVYLLINLLSDRDWLTSSKEDSDSQLLAVRKDVAHTLCFKPLSYSDLSARLTERAQEHQKLQEILEAMTIYRPPEGLNDTGLFELKEEYLAELDPFNSHFSKNQRDEAENIYKKWMSKKTGKPFDDIVLEPKLRPIRSESYQNLCAVVRQPIFAHVTMRCLVYVTQSDQQSVPATRKEAFLHVLLQLILIATLEDDTQETTGSEPSSKASFIENAYSIGIVDMAHRLWTMDEYTSCKSKIRHILRLFNQRRPAGFSEVTRHLEFPAGRFDTASPASLESELEAKKKRARERNAEVMAQFQRQQQSFMDKQGVLDWPDEDLDEPDAEMPTTTETRTWRFPTGQCIQCREDTADTRIYGTFAMICDGHVLRQTPTSDTDFVREIFNVPESLDTSLADQRPFGVSGANHEQIRQFTSDKREIVQDFQGLGKGWPLDCTLKGPLSTSCGHIMHFSCFENYYQSVTRRHSQQVARNHAERVTLKEFVCPLCKALANVFLPVVWKGTEQSYPGVLQTEVEGGLEQFIDQTLNPEDPRNEPITGVFPKDIITSIHQETMVSFSSTPMAAAARALGDNSDQRGLANLPAYKDLAGVYTLLQESIKVFGDGASSTDTSSNLQMNIFLDILANTVATTEIAYRGRESASLLMGIPQQSLSHLQSLAATFRAYSAVGYEFKIPSDAAAQYCEIYGGILAQLFTPWASGNSFNDAPLDSACPPVLEMDSFQFFTRASMVLCTMNRQAKLRYYVQLCLVAELLRVVLVYTTQESGREILLASGGEHLDGHEARAEIHAVKELLRWTEIELHKHDQTTWLVFEALSDSVLAGLLKLMKTHALVFLRKSVILLHAAHGVDVPDVSSTEAGTELTRLSQLLKIPPIVSLIAPFSHFAPESMLKTLAGGWIWACTQGRGRKVPSIKLLHPAPLELVGLPKYFDVLMEESHRRRCPTTGKEVSDPALCLFCGEIFCSQTFCCTKNNRGGCNNHLEKCSSPIGIFLFIRKCHVVLLHVGKEKRMTERGGKTISTSHGSFFAAPYLTKHGETDSGLRSKQQLILNQKRYDKLIRDVWLMVNGSVWSQIARKLEGEVNAGGWETL